MDNDSAKPLYDCKLFSVKKIKQNNSTRICGSISELLSKSNQGNQGSSGNQKNIILGQRPDIENGHTQKRT